MPETQIIEIGADPNRRERRDMDLAFAIRRAVFCLEQGVSEAEEIDGLDGICRHYLAIASGLAVATARTRPLATGDTKIERVAVLEPHRRTGIGNALMTRIIDDTLSPMVLNAQLAAQRFYTGLGFVARGPVFEEAGIEHVAMTRTGMKTDHAAGRPRTGRAGLGKC
jgi:predicted GNAT family N-acyltransferase